MVAKGAWLGQGAPKPVAVDDTAVRVAAIRAIQKISYDRGSGYAQDCERSRDRDAIAQIAKGAKAP